MAQSDPLSALVTKVATWAEKVDPSKPAAQKPDTSWHDEMVRKATESFTKAQPANKAAAKKVQPQQGRPAAGKTTQRKPVQKRWARKAQ